VLSFIKRLLIITITAIICPRASLIRRGDMSVYTAENSAVNIDFENTTFFVAGSA